MEGIKFQLFHFNFEAANPQLLTKVVGMEIRSLENQNGKQN